MGFNNKIIALSSINDTQECLDYYFTQAGRDLQPLPNSGVILKPIFAINKEKKNHKKFSKVQNYEIIKVIGKGGFSKVLQGTLKNFYSYFFS
jgi:hypothetical protein